MTCLPLYHKCLQCGISCSKAEQPDQFCSAVCRKVFTTASTRPPRAKTGRKSRTTSHAFPSYQKDRELFAQRMAYTLNGMTWWATPCCYCGDPAEVEEHVFPISAFKKLLAVGSCQISHDLLRLVPACHECNSLLSDKVFKTFEEKRLYAKSALAKRFYEVLDCPQWTPEELESLTGRMQTWIAERQSARDLVFERLRY
jgi:hypothetical protein